MLYKFKTLHSQHIAVPNACATGSYKSGIEGQKKVEIVVAQVACTMHNFWCCYWCQWSRLLIHTELGHGKRHNWCNHICWCKMLHVYCLYWESIQTLICVLVARPRRCPTLSNPVPWQNWMAAYLGYTLWMRTQFRGWLVMVHDTHMRRRRIWQIKYLIWSDLICVGSVLVGPGTWPMICSYFFSHSASSFCYTSKCHLKLLYFFLCLHQCRLVVSMTFYKKKISATLSPFETTFVYSFLVYSLPL